MNNSLEVYTAVLLATLWGHGVQRQKFAVPENDTWAAVNTKWVDYTFKSNQLHSAFVSNLKKALWRYTWSGFQRAFAARFMLSLLGYSAALTVPRQFKQSLPGC